MPFGVHKGKQLEDIPTDYIEYILREFDLKDVLEMELENQLKLRRGEGVKR